jgi:hypothetical protein
MQPKLWSLNHLAVELGRDRRALAKELEGLAPDDEQQIPCGAARDRDQIDIAGLETARPERSSDERTARFWKLSRVIEHLYGRRSTAGDFNSERARLTKMQADKAELDLAVRRGELAPLAEVEERFGEVLQTVRTGYIALPSKVAPLLLNQGSVSTIEATLREHVHETMREVYDYLVGTADDDATADQSSPRIRETDPGPRGERAGADSRAGDVPARNAGDQQDRLGGRAGAGDREQVPPATRPNRRSSRRSARDSSALIG